jgi:RNA polymerase subunit RPABC4/transcription elongation factor Spt4
MTGKNICPGCGSKILNTLYRIKRSNDKRQWKSKNAKICDNCNIIIPNDSSIGFWNGSEVVRLSANA